MKIEIFKCDLCKKEYRQDVPDAYKQIGKIKLDMKGCYHIQMIWEKEVCSNCGDKIKDAINKIMKELYIEK